MAGYRDVGSLPESGRLLSAILAEDRRRTRTDLAIFLAYALLALVAGLFGSGFLPLPGPLLPDLPAWLTSPAFVSIAALASMILLAATAIGVHRRRRYRLALVIERLDMLDRRAYPPLV